MGQENQRLRVKTDITQKIGHKFRRWNSTCDSNEKNNYQTLYDYESYFGNEQQCWCVLTRWVRQFQNPMEMDTNTTKSIKTLIKNTTRFNKQKESNKEYNNDTIQMHSNHPISFPDDILNLILKYSCTYKWKADRRTKQSKYCHVLVDSYADKMSLYGNGATVILNDLIYFVKWKYQIPLNNNDKNNNNNNIDNGNKLVNPYMKGRIKSLWSFEVSVNKIQRGKMRIGFARIMNDDDLTTTKFNKVNSINDIINFGGYLTFHARHNEFQVNTGL